jgi:malate dehydrogenase
MSHHNKPIRIVITGAAGQIGYSLVPLIASGEMFGPNQPVILALLEIEYARDMLDGMVMELQDGAYPLLHEVIPTTDPNVAFDKADICLLVGAFPRKEGMQRSDLLAKNIDIFKVHGSAIERLASRNAKVLVVGNPANTNCYVCKHFAPSINPKNFSALTRLDHNRAVSEIAKRVGANVSEVKNVIIWGNHSDTQFPDVSHGFLRNRDSPLKNAVNDDTYLQNDFLTFVQKRGGVIMAKRKLSSAMSAAKAIVDHMKNWVYGTTGDEWVSMAVVSDGSYDVEPGLFYSFPVICRNGDYEIVKGLNISDFARSKMNLTMQELQSEKDIALGLLNPK